MNEATICSRLMGLGLTKSQSRQIIDKINLWSTKSGPEWTVSRLKEQKLMFIHNVIDRKSGTSGQYIPRMWVAQREGVPLGPFAPVFRMSSRRKLSKALTALTIYSKEYASVATSKQLDKFLGSVSSSDVTGMDAIPRILPPQYQGKKVPVPTWIEVSTSSTRRAPGANGISTVPELDVTSTFLHAARSNPIRMIVARHEQHFNSVIPVDVFFNQEPHPTGHLGHSVGVLSGIQEGGYKLRGIANPSRVLQAALVPLQISTLEILKGIKTDFTHDQPSAFPIIQKWMREGRKVHSIDLSDATNLFPWPYQREMIEEAFTHFNHRAEKTGIRIMDEVCSSPWVTKLRGAPEKIFFTRGQPLGLGPSFAVFALTHNYLLSGICEQEGINPNSFCVLGDDVVIGNDRLAKVYRHTLRNLGCIVSEAKCITSNKVAEFAGAIITPNTVARGLKWKEVSLTSTMDFVRNHGPSAIGTLPKAMQESILKMRTLPIELGGLGYGDGIPLSERLSSPEGLAAISYYLTRPERPTVVRDLVSVIAGVFHQLTDLQSPYLYTDFYKDILPLTKGKVGALWDHPRIVTMDMLRESAIHCGLPCPRSRLIPKGGKRQPWEVSVTPTSGDPRPSFISLLAGMIRTGIWDPPASVRRFISSHHPSSERFYDHLSLLEHLAAPLKSSGFSPERLAEEYITAVRSGDLPADEGKLAVAISIAGDPGREPGLRL